MTRSEYFSSVSEKYHFSKTKRNIILTGTPDHGNLGDHAIAYATLKLLKEVFPDDLVTEINMHDFAFDIDAIYHIVKPEDIFILQGGGNLGNIYMDDEMIRRYVVGRFPDNKIILFPQSVYFTEDPDGMRELAISSQFYGANKNLYLIARDNKSECFLKKNFRNPVYRLPDVAMTLPSFCASQKREGVLLCLRNDQENILQTTVLEELDYVLEKRFSKITKTDTVVEYSFENFDRMKALEKKWEELSSAELMITDRLHGVIFSILTGTPCIAFPELTQKIPGILEDLKGYGNVVLVNSIVQLDAALGQLKKGDSFFPRKDIYNKFRFVINKIANEKIRNSGENTISIGPAEIFTLAGYWSRQYYGVQKGKQDETRKLYRQYNQRLKELEDYKSWVYNLELQIEQLKKDYSKAIDDRIAKSEETEKLYIQYNQRLKELDDYKNWVHNLEAQVEQLKDLLTINEQI